MYDPPQSDPLRAFRTVKHAGTLGKSFSQVHVSNPRVRVLALGFEVQWNGKPG
jgi:hypothetical protein